MSDLEIHRIKPLVDVRALGVTVARFEGQPVNRVDDMLIFQGGFMRKMTRWERLRLWLKLPVYLPPPTPQQVEIQRAFNAAQDRAFLHGK